MKTTLSREHRKILETTVVQALAVVTEIAYEHWHRMLFARFLAETIYSCARTAIPLAWLTARKTLAKFEPSFPNHGGNIAWAVYPSQDTNRDRFRQHAEGARWSFS